MRPVYLPKTENENERFYNFYTREEYAPGQTIEVPVDISSIPLFVRSGAIPVSYTHLDVYKRQPSWRSLNSGRV